MSEPSVPLRYTQNFLHSPQLVKQIVDLAQIGPGETVLEIGPGKGIITSELASRVGSQGEVVALELDQVYAALLRQKFYGIRHVQILQQDALQFDLHELPKNYRVFANVPFNITAKIFSWLFTPNIGPHHAHLILQTESLLEVDRQGKTVDTFKSLSLQPWYEIKPQHRFSRSDFTPAPATETTLFHFQKRTTPLVHAQSYETYLDFLAYISRDRVGEGAWLKLFLKRELTALANQTKLQLGRGLKSQSLTSLINVFHTAILPRQDRKSRISGAMKLLRQEQDRREKLNLAGKHHRPTTRRT